MMLRAPIVAGPLRGRWWLPVGGGKVWRVLGGTYEAEQTALFGDRVRPGDVVLDLGAHIGYYTLLASRLVGPAGRVYAFEPHPRNARYLRRHVAMNRCLNVEVLERAAYDRRGTLGFDFGSGSGTGRIREGGPMSVAAVRLDDFAAERGISPRVLKVDVEGGERPVLAGAREILRGDRPLLFLSTHGDEQASECRCLLAGLGYRMLPLGLNAAGDHVCVPEESGEMVEAAPARAAAP